MIVFLVLIFLITVPPLFLAPSIRNDAKILPVLVIEMKTNFIFVFLHILNNSNQPTLFLQKLLQVRILQTFFLLNASLDDLIHALYCQVPC